MGRQAYLTRLAFGRSPYGETLRDEKGDLLIGPHSHDNATKGYVQQFDEKGKPSNLDTEASDRKLRRAQNEVLRIVGVTRRKNDVQEPKPFKSLSVEQRVELLAQENSSAHNVEVRAYVLCDLSSWWLQSLRRRLCVGWPHLSTHIGEHY